jgi:hypothetical protein
MDKQTINLYMDMVKKNIEEKEKDNNAIHLISKIIYKEN